MHKAFTRHCLSDAFKNLGVEVKTYARTARDNAYIVARGFAPRTRVLKRMPLAALGLSLTKARFSSRPSFNAGKSS